MGRRRWVIVLALAGCSAGCAVGVVAEDDRQEPAPTSGKPAAAAARPIAEPAQVMLFEDDACARVADAIVDRALGAGCWVTMHVCPDLLRVDAGEACLLYDRARVDACVASIAESDVCGSVVHVPCEPLALADTAPAGCMLGDEPPP